MWKTVRICERLSSQLKKLPLSRRTFLSDAYRCEEEWSKRLSTPLLQKVNLEAFYIAVNQKFTDHGKAHPVDIDIFANTITESSHELDELVDLLHKLRFTTETSNTLESTHHAVVRSFLKGNRIDDLLVILHDRLNYGIFPDSYALNILMDTLIKQKDHTSAARVGALLMLQEDTENPISNSLALHACYEYLKNPGSNWVEPAPPVDESKEEIKVRVKYIRNPFFDDHFDLQKPRHLVGKTLAFFGKNMGGSLGRSCQLMGLVAYEKYDAAAALIRQWMSDAVRRVVHEDAIKLIKEDIAKIPEAEQTDSLKSLISEIGLLEKLDLVKENLDEAVQNDVKSAVSKNEEGDIASQIQIYAEWIDRRQEVMNEQLAELDRQKRLAQLKVIKKDLTDRERVLTFFENEEQIDLAIEQIEAKQKRSIKPTKQTSELTDQDYIPPEVRSRSTGARS